MRLTNLIAALAAALTISACARTTDPTDPYTSAAAFAQEQGVLQRVPFYDVTEFNVVVPRDLKVSEANSYYPRADIVWRGDPQGDRYLQIQAIFEEAIERGTANMKGADQVAIEVTIQRFHSVTEKTRYSVGGVHSIRFDLTIRDSETGMIVEQPRTIRADLKSYRGAQALAADARGETQKVRVTSHLAEVIKAELRAPTQDEVPALSLVQASE